MKSYIKYQTDEMDDTELEITDLFVAITERGQGKGKILVAQAVQYAIDNNYNSIGLYAEPQTNDGLVTSALIAFYKSCGFNSNGDCSQLMTMSLWKRKRGNYGRNRGNVSRYVRRGVWIWLRETIEEVQALFRAHKKELKALEKDYQEG